jgi:tetratricopeptide (TPR) repeat protein
MKRFLLALLCALLACATAMTQDAPASAPAPTSKDSAAPAKPDYSQEPFVFEQYTTKIRFENDGTGERDYMARILVQSDAGVQALGELTFGYSSANEQMTIPYVRVRKADGSVVTADAAAVKDMTAAVAHDAPVYTDYKEKHVTVPSLHAGDTLEYEVDSHLATPLATGEFWYAQNFLRGAIVLDETLEVNLPDGRAVKLASEGNEYQTARNGGRVIYTWKHAFLSRPSDDDQKNEAQDSKQKAPDVEFTTFKSWEDVAKWYASLEQGRSDPNTAIQEKAAELTQGKTTALEKVQALYDYVAKNIRYVSLSFGLGRYQPHTAAEVFANQYGDCKDKATLLAAMMRAAGISSDVALIPASSKLDETMPAPTQFDHVITAVPQGNDLVWMDSTTEVAPFRLLAAPLRDKSALLVAPDGKGRIVRTPADPPFLSTQTVQTEGTVSDLGKLTGTVRYSVRGDQELLLRLAFRHAPQAKWKELGAEILQQDGLDAEATSVETSDVSDTQNPFQVTIHFTQSNFLAWMQKEPNVKLPFLSIGLPETNDENTAPIELGSPLNVDVRLKLTLPPNFKGRAPVGVAVARDYAQFTSSYSLEGPTLTAQRSLNFKMRELPADRTSDYLAFAHAVESDEEQSLHLMNASIGAGAPQIPQTAKVEDVMDAAESALHGSTPQDAVPLLKRVIELDPKKYEKKVWNDLGIAYMLGGKDDEAIAAFNKQLDVNPYDQNGNRALAVIYTRNDKFEDAVDAYKKQLEIQPLDPGAHAGLGELLHDLHRDNEAIPELEKAAAISPNAAIIEATLGSAYLNTGQKDKANEAFDRAIELAPNPTVWNNVAFALADAKVDLDKAQQYAESAVDSNAADLRTIELKTATMHQFQEGESIAALWDTLGWVYFQKGDFAKAGRYLQSAWIEGERGTMADHLGQLFQKQGQKDQAANAFAEGLASRHPNPDTRAHMILLLGGNEKIDALVAKARPELLQQRTFSAGKLLNEKAEATFEILLSPAGADGASTNVENVKFVSGSESLRAFADRVRAINFGTVFPDGSPVKLVEIGTLSCAASGDCSFVLTLPEEVHSLQ